MVGLLTVGGVATVLAAGCPVDATHLQDIDQAQNGDASSGSMGGSSGAAGGSNSTSSSGLSASSTSTSSASSSSSSGSSDDSGTSTDGGDGDGDGDGGTSSGGPADAAPDAVVDSGGSTTGLDPNYRHFDINHILETGQSNAVANSSRPLLSTTQPYNNKMFDVGVMTGTNCDGNGCQTVQTPTGLVPLVEGDTFFAGSPVETMSAGLANAVTKVAREKYLVGNANASHDLLMSLHGRSGRTYWCLRKTSCAWLPGYQNPKPFTDGMNQVTKGKELAQAAGKTYVVRAVTAIHGESDHNGYARGRPEFPLDGTDGTVGKLRDYADALIEWQQDYDAGVKAITAQTISVPLLISGISGWNERVSMSVVANMQLAAHVRAPGKVVLVAPPYSLPFQGDCLHFTAASERRLGEYFAKAYRRIVLEGGVWEPLRPLAVTRNANVISIQYVVPKPPLVMDTNLVSAVANNGFTYVDSAGTPTITQVRIVSADTVEITLASTPTGANRKIRYAQNQNASTCVGPFLGARGNLRDSDTTPTMWATDTSINAGGPFNDERYRAPLYNWGVMFEMDVP